MFSITIGYLVCACDLELNMFALGIEEVLWSGVFPEGCVVHGRILEVTEHICECPESCIDTEIPVFIYHIWVYTEGYIVIYMH